MSKIVKSADGCVARKVFYVEPGTTEEEIREEIKDIIEKGDVLVKSPLGPKYNHGYDLWKLYYGDDAIDDNIMDEDLWDLAEQKLED